MSIPSRLGGCHFLQHFLRLMHEMPLSQVTGYGLPLQAGPFSRVIFHHSYDGDTCTVTLPGLPDVFGERISIRLVGIDAPEIKGRCEQEKRLAMQARDFLN